MELSAILAGFERDPSGCEKLLKDETRRDCSAIASTLCDLSRPLQSDGTASLVSDSIRLLSLVTLHQIIEKYWTLSPSFLKRTKQPPNGIPRVRDDVKNVVMERLLGDAALEQNFPCARKRAQCIASIARYDWMRWDALFPTLTVAIHAPPITQGLQALVLHSVLKELASTQRIGHQAAALQKVVGEIYPKLFHQMSLIFRRTANFEAMPDEDADLAARIAKSINELIRGSPSVVELVLGPHFEVVLASLSLRPSSRSTARLLWALRKTCLVSMRCHPIMFRDLFLGVFAERTAQTLHSSSASMSSEAEAELLIFCFAFWTELVSQKSYQQNPADALDRSLPIVARQALIRLRLSEDDVEQWRCKGGEHFCAEDDGEGEASLVQSWKEDSVRRAARRFLQACFDQPLPSRANAVVTEIFGTPYVDSLAIEAAFLAVQLSAVRLHGKWNFDDFLRSRLLPCFSPSTTTIDACIARRACLVIRAWVFDLGPESVSFVISALAQVMSRADCDLGVAIAAIDCAQGLLNEAPVTTSPASMPMINAIIAPLLAQRSLCRLLARFELPESRCRVLVLVETLMLIIRDSSTASDVLAELVPIALAKEGKGLVERAALDLAGTCVQSAGFASLSATARAICLDLVALACANHNPALDDAWPRLLLLCLRTADSCESVRPLFDRTVLQSIPHLRLQCAAVEACARLWRNDVVNGRPAAIPDVSFALWDLSRRFILAQERGLEGSDTDGEAKTEEGKSRDEGVIAREDPDDPFEALHVCRCLDMLVRTRLGHVLVSAAATSTMPPPSTPAAVSSGIQAFSSPMTHLHRLSLSTSPPSESRTALQYLALDVSTADDIRGLNKACWAQIVNSPNVEIIVDDHSDSRDVIERITLVARVLLSHLASFASIAPAAAFATLCLKYIDAVGFAPSEAAWRRRLWASALLMTLSMCRGLSETRQVLPCAVQACAVVVRTQEEGGQPEPPCFNAVDEDAIATELDLDRQRKERLFIDDEFIASDTKQAFSKVWQMLVARFGSDQLAQMVAEAERAEPPLQSPTQGTEAGVAFDKGALSLMLS